MEDSTKEITEHGSKTRRRQRAAGNLCRMVNWSWTGAMRRNAPRTTNVMHNDPQGRRGGRVDRGSLVLLTTRDLRGNVPDTTAF